MITIIRSTIRESAMVLFRQRWYPMPGAQFCNREDEKKNEPAEICTADRAQYVHRNTSFRHVRLSGFEARFDADIRTDKKRRRESRR